MAEYSQVEMLLAALPSELRVQVVLPLELDIREPSTFNYNKLRKHVHKKCVTPAALTLRDAEGAITTLRFSRSSIPAGFLLPKMPVVVNLSVLPSEATQAPAQATKKHPIPKVRNTIDMTIDKMTTAFEGWTILMSKANEPINGGHQTARAYPIPADHALPHSPMDIPPPKAPTGPASYRPGRNYQQHPWQVFGPSM